jgi:hypothetical protein
MVDALCREGAPEKVSVIRSHGRWLQATAGVRDQFHSLHTIHADSDETASTVHL